MSDNGKHIVQNGLTSTLSTTEKVFKGGILPSKCQIKIIKDIKLPPKKNTQAKKK